MRGLLAAIIGFGMAGAGAAQTPPGESAPPELDLPKPAPPSTTSAGRPICAPAKLTRMTVRNISPGLAAASPAAQPRTLHRRDSIYLRSEESPDPQRGQQVVIVAEPDIWQVNLATRAGVHQVDPGPDLVVHAPILPVVPDMPPQLLTLEYGCELQFLQAAGAAEPRQVVPWGADKAGLHVVEFGAHAVTILMNVRREAPLMLAYLREGKAVFAIRYDAYRADLPDNPALFQPPKNMRITEGPPAKPQPASPAPAS